MVHQSAVRNHPFKLALGVAISLGALALSLRGVSASQLWAQLALANYWYLLLHLAVLLLIQLARTVRWGLLVAPLEKLPFVRLAAICAVGFMALVVLPLRLGEFARPYLLREPGRVSGSAAMASVVFERLVDGLAVTAFLLVFLVGLPGDVPHVEWVRRGAVAMLLLFVGLLAAIVAARWRREWLSRFVGGSVGVFAPRLAQRVRRMIDAFVGGLSSIPSVREAAGIFALTGAYWGLNGLATWLLALGFDIHLTFSQAFTCLGIRALGITLPAGPGMVGTFQAFMQLGLSMFVPGLEPARAAAFANVLWFCQFGQQVLLGLLFLNSRALAADQHVVTLAELSRAGEALDER